ncbi:MAG: nucleotidyltransferase family protein [Cyclobacteriaceae bacterium]
MVAIVLAAGASSRMGNNKLLLDKNGKPMIEWTIDSVSRARIQQLVIVSGRDADVIQTIANAYDCKVVHNSSYSSGLTSSIKLGVDACSQNGSGLMICLGDMPMITTNQYNQLIDRFDENKQNGIVRPYFGDQPGHPVIFAASYRQQLLECDEMEGCASVIQSNKGHLVELPVDSTSFVQDFDRPSDLINWQ